MERYAYLIFEVFKSIAGYFNHFAGLLGVFAIHFFRGRGSALEHLAFVLKFGGYREVLANSLDITKSKYKTEVLAKHVKFTLFSSRRL